MEHENENIENNRPDAGQTVDQNTQQEVSQAGAAQNQTASGQAGAGQSQGTQSQSQGAQAAQNPDAGAGQNRNQGAQGGSEYHSAFENYPHGPEGRPPHHGRGPEGPGDELHRELKKYRKMSAIELVVIAVLAGVTTGLITYTALTPNSAKVIASQQETIRQLQEEQKDSGSSRDDNDDSNGDDYGAQEIPFFGGGNGSGSDNGSGSSGNNSDEEEEDPSSIDTTVQLGIYCTEVTDEVSETYGIPSGVVVADFSEEDSNAEKAGLQKGDVITKVDDTEVTTVTQLKKALQNYDPGDKVTLTVERRSGNDYKEQTVSFRLEAKEDASDNASK